MTLGSLFPVLRLRWAAYSRLLYVFGVFAALFAALPVLAQSSSVTINSDKVLVVNGQKVFGLTVSPGPPVGAQSYTGGDALDELRSGGILFYRIPLTPTWKSGSSLDPTMVATNQAALDWCAQHGMFDLLNLNDISSYSSTDTTTPALLQSVVNMFMNHPGLGMYKNKDEAWWGGTSEGDLQRGYDLTHQLDPNHPVEQTHAPRGQVSDLQPYNAAADILMVDNYPVVTNSVASNPPITNTQVSQFGDWTHELAQVANGQKEFWMVEQIAFSGTVPPSHTLIFPTYTQERFMAYQAIANGARGLMFFGGNVTNTFTNATDLALGWNWTFWTNILKPLTLQLSPGSPSFGALVAPDSLVPISMSGTTYPDIEFCVRESGPSLYILATKREGATTNVTFSGLPSWATNADVLYESNRTVAVTNGQMTDSFAQWDVHVYRFNYTGTSPTLTYQPLSRTNLAGQTETFVVTALGTGTLTYQWRKNGTNLSDGNNIAGSTSSKLTVSTIGAGDDASYDVVVTSTGSVTSSPPAHLSVNLNLPPSISAQPQSRTDLMGTMATFSVTAGGAGPLIYQWRKNGSNLSDGGNITGSSVSNLTLLSVAATDAGSYDVVVTGIGSLTSAPPATLTVIAYDTNQLILYEPFAYTNVGGPVSSNTPADWSNSGSGANDLNVASGSLTCAGLLTSLGNSVTNGGAGLGTRRLLNTTVGSGVVYLSALLRINDLGFGAWNGASTQIGSMQSSNNTAQFQIMIKSNSPTGYVLGVTKNGTGASTVFDTTEYHSGDTVLVVGKYDFTASNNIASLWINPSLSTFGAGLAPGVTVSVSDGTNGVPMDRFNMRQNTTGSVPANMQWDELRFGYSWAAVTPVGPPLITVQPTNQTKVLGQSVTFSVAATGVGTLSYQWQCNGTNISGATTNTYSRTNLQTTDAGSYSVTITNLGGSVNSTAAILVVNAAPSITGQPQSQTVSTGMPAPFTVSVSGTAPLIYQWSHNGNAISGATASSYTVVSAQTNDAGTYSVVVTNVVGSATSSSAFLNVLGLGNTARLLPLWSAAPGSNPWVTANGGANTPLERTIAYSAAFNQLYVVQRNGSLATIYALSAADGSFLYKLNTNGYTYTGNIPLCGIAVADDGALYVCNNDTSGAGVPNLKVYRWGSSDPFTPPKLVYSGDPLGGVNARWGDSLDVRGSGTNTVLIIDDHQPNTSNPNLGSDIVILQPADTTMTNFTGKYYKMDAVNNPSFASTSIGHSLQFDPSGTYFWQKHFGQALAKNSYNPAGTNGSAATWVTNYSAFSSTLGPVSILFQSNLLAGINFSGVLNASPDVLELYDVSQMNVPLLLGSYAFPANVVSNFNHIGQIIMTTNYVFALEANNGLMAFQLAGLTPPSVTAQPQNQTVLAGNPVSLTVAASGSTPLIYQWRLNGASIAAASNSVYTIASAQLSDAGSYTVVITNAVGAVLSSNAVLFVYAQPTMSLQSATDGSVHLHIVGVANQNYIIQYETDLGTLPWQTLFSGPTDNSGLLEFIDTPPPGIPSRFYRFFPSP